MLFGDDTLFLFMIPVRRTVRSLWLTHMNMIGELTNKHGDILKRDLDGHQSMFIRESKLFPAVLMTIAYTMPCLECGRFGGLVELTNKDWKLTRMNQQTRGYRLMNSGWWHLTWPYTYLHVYVIYICKNHTTHTQYIYMYI